MCMLHENVWIYLYTIYSRRPLITAFNNYLSKQNNGKDRGKITSFLEI